MRHNARLHYSCVQSATVSSWKEKACDRTIMLLRRRQRCLSLRHAPACCAIAVEAKGVLEGKQQQLPPPDSLVQNSHIVMTHIYDSPILTGFNRQASNHVSVHVSLEARESA